MSYPRYRVGTWNKVDDDDEHCFSKFQCGVAFVYSIFTYVLWLKQWPMICVLIRGGIHVLGFIYYATASQLNQHLPVILPQPKYGLCGCSLNASILNRIDSFPVVLIDACLNSFKILEVFVFCSFQAMFMSCDCPAAACSASPSEEFAVFTHRYWKGAGT